MAALDLAGRRLEWGRRTYVMGIVNVTPDSFSGDGLADPAAAVRLGLALAAAGADLLDVGGESTRPGSEPVPPELERTRVLPVLAGLRAACDLPLSVDTRRASVAEAACRAGAVVVNDISGLQDPELPGVAAGHGAALVVMHNRRSLLRDGSWYPERPYGDVVAEVAEELHDLAERAVRAGVPRERLVFDPGIGFGKTPADNLALLRGLRSLPRPLLVGPSRKSFIGHVLGLPPAERDEGTAAAVSLAIAGGADVVRVHDVRAMARVARLADAIVRGA